MQFGEDLCLLMQLCAWGLGFLYLVIGLVFLFYSIIILGFNSFRNIRLFPESWLECYLVLMDPFATSVDHLFSLRSKRQDAGSRRICPGLADMCNRVLLEILCLGMVCVWAARHDFSRWIHVGYLEDLVM